jgi:hypothetical protein
VKIYLKFINEVKTMRNFKEEARILRNMGLSEGEILTAQVERGLHDCGILAMFADRDKLNTAKDRWETFCNLFALVKGIDLQSIEKRLGDIKSIPYQSGSRDVEEIAPNPSDFAFNEKDRDQVKADIGFLKWAVEKCPDIDKSIPEWISKMLVFLGKCSQSFA